ncbi:CPBP family intramembrane glutamic endopeptidase [Bacillus sp. CGMCC 1.16541]|uniref:CPBP family intramembrane glutamic endopeptidase n=1 Tax=Bacillus sp. CGMCC 1.16541 TaxID=2185143 RepID=UPI001EF56BBE|nr:CPBP family intramembrane glutamic endopeptidase [Bacillus sp. CGMCC 1.16541]
MDMFKNQQKIIDEMSHRELLHQLYMTQLFLFSIALGIGFWKYKSVTEITSYFKFDFVPILLYGGGSAVIVVLVDILFMKLLPPHMYDDGGINKRIFKDLSLIQLILLCFVVAIAEELLFRGVLQVHFGIIWASIIFALMHIRYLSKWFLLVMVVTLSFFLGWLFELTQSLFVTIVAHFLIDFMLGLHIRFNESKGV